MECITNNLEFAPEQKLSKRSDIDQISDRREDWQEDNCREDEILKDYSAYKTELHGKMY